MPFGNEIGRNSESGRGSGRKGLGRGRLGGNSPGSGPGGYCICPNQDCNTNLSHQVGQPCYNQKCPKCGTRMVRG